MSDPIPTVPPSLTPKQTEIADAALRVIGAQGITALTTATLAAELGVSQGAPFRHFATRDEILEAVAIRVETLFMNTFPSCDCSARERIQSLFLARAGAVGQHAGIARLMFSDQFALALPQPAASRLKHLVTKTRAFLLDSLRDGAQQGEFRSDLAPEAMLPIVLGTLQHLVFARSLGAAKGAEVSDSCATLCLLLAPPGSPKATKPRKATSTT